MSLFPLVAGFLLGLEHALDADHLIAISTIAAQARSVRRSLAAGLWWGIGHAASLALASLVVVALGVRIPAGIDLSFELAAAVMLVALGLGVIRKHRRERLHSHAHEHDGVVHVHVHRHRLASDHEHAHSARVSRRALLVGSVHGLAGSAALTLVVLGTVRDPQIALAWVAVFAAGSVTGMAAASALIGAAFVSASARLRTIEERIRLSVGLASVALGAWIGVQLLR